jgi:hypothetical protein
MRYSFKVANMRKEQDFILYPYSGGDEIVLQSNQRIARVNLRTGEGIINSKNKNYSCFADLVLNPLKMNLPEHIKTSIQSRLWHNNGKTESVAGGAVIIEHKPLFSKVN